jgi:hypothetical protein
MNSDAAVASRGKALAVLSSYADDKDIAARKAALLATVYLAGTPKGRGDPAAGGEAVGCEGGPGRAPRRRDGARPAGVAGDANVIEALQSATRTGDEHDAELGWSAALSLAQLGQTDVAPTILKLLSREELSQLKYYDRESDPGQSDVPDTERLGAAAILINTMIGARKLQSPEVQEATAEAGPSPTRRPACARPGREILADPSATPVGPAPRLRPTTRGHSAFRPVPIPESIRNRRSLRRSTAARRRPSSAGPC